MSSTAGLLTITLHRLNERQSAAAVLRDDGVTLRVPGYGRNSPLPHDLAHAVVERELRLAHGFWGSVAAGAVFPGMAVLAGRRRPHAQSRSHAMIRANGPEIGAAELLVGWFVERMRHAPTRDTARELASLADAQSVLGGHAVVVPEADLHRTSAALNEAAALWSGVPVGGTMVMYWSVPGARMHQVRRAT